MENVKQFVELKIKEVKFEYIESDQAALTNMANMFSKFKDEVLLQMREAIRESRREVKDNQNTTTVLVQDHETRLRTLEGKILRWGGIFLALALIAQMVGGVITTVIITHLFRAITHIPPGP